MRASTGVGGRNGGDAGANSVGWAVSRASPIGHAGDDEPRWPVQDKPRRMPGLNAMTRDTLMEWTSDRAGERYSLTLGTCHATIWYSAMDHWTASVSRTSVSIGQHSFTTPQDAQAWCEAQLREFAADGYCAADAGVPPL